MTLVTHAIVDFIVEGRSGRIMTVRRDYTDLTVGSILDDAADFARETGMIVHDAFLIESTSPLLRTEWEAIFS